MTTTKGLFEVDSVVAIYDRHDEAERAIRTLQASGIDMRTLSVAARDPEMTEHVTGYYTAGDRMLHWGKLGAFWGALWGILFDSALFAIPGIGPVLLAGPLVAWIVAILEGAVVVGGLSALGAGLVSIGIPRQSVIEYETALRTNKFLLIVHGTRREVTKAKEIIGKTQPQFHTLHSERVFAN
ncbi:putative membrane protein [Granulicella aggregans]|uniref:Putative membrane protein n=1 Tax=Granulicella aggregans TaxID=474949 RepID=A0A7W7ZJ92_9BACT|nr:general stress protein [Granulicella aggregans]MBB5060954.1 putative membrane protein [Granulicella aggregans]